MDARSSPSAAPALDRDAERERVHGHATATWLHRIRELRLIGYSLDEARAIAGPMPAHRDGEPDIAGGIAYDVILAATEELGWTRHALAAAYIAVATSDAFEEEDHPCP